MNCIHPKSNNPPQDKKERYLWIALGLTSIFTIVEIIGGWVFNSLALLSDAAHMFTDVASLVIALIAIQIGKKVADVKRTFGYYRFEILAAVLNAIILFFVAIYIFYEAYQRLFVPSDIQPIGMLIVAAFGLLVNVIAIKLLKEGSKENLNVRGAYLEAWADMLGSVGVILAAIIIYFTHWQGVDSIIAIIIGLWVLPRTWLLLKESINILLEGVPAGIELNKIQTALESLPNVANVHDLHIWAVTSGKTSLTVHLVINPSTIKSLDNPRHQDDQDKDHLQFSQHILLEANALLKSQFKITHSTIQIETEHCGHDDLMIMDASAI